MDNKNTQNTTIDTMKAVNQTDEVEVDVVVIHVEESANIVDPQKNKNLVSLSSVQVPQIKRPEQVSDVWVSRNHKLSKASPGQIMKRIFNITKSKPKNKYQLELYKFFDSFVPEFVQCYNQMVFGDKDTEDYDEIKSVRIVNLLGMLPKTLSIDTNITKQDNLFLASIGDMINALRQRLTFICQRNSKELYSNNDKQCQEFEKLQVDVTIFMDKLVDFEDGFRDANQKAHLSKKEY